MAAGDRGRRALGALTGLLLAALVPALASAHPLGNFTTNHYAGVRIEPGRILLDIVIDQAEIPAFQARQELDLDEDGQVSDAELERGRLASCDSLAGQLRLAVDGKRLTPEMAAAGLELRPGVGGLPTMRLVCGFEAVLADPIAPGTRIEFADESYADRLGWREIVVEASGVSVEAVDGELRTTNTSGRLNAYPQALLSAALADERIVIEVTPGGDVLPPFKIPDATPVERPDAAAPEPDPSPIRATSAGGTAPGGVGGEIPALFQTADLTPIVLLLSLLTAAALGAGHALTPGHGKTLMAAYLVGIRGTPIHALGLGLSVSVSHTLGIVLLALLVIGAQGVLNPDLVVRVAPFVAAVTIVGIGAWMLWSEVRRRTASDMHDHGHEDHGREHSHGGRRHTHAPVASATITWRSLFVLGLAGGIIPSTNALLILLGTIAAGRPAFGLVLVVAFGLGMALVMAGVGLVMIVARGRLDALSLDTPLGRVRSWVPLGAAVVVLGLGLVLSVQAITAPPAL